MSCITLLWSSIHIPLQWDDFLLCIIYGLLFTKWLVTAVSLWRPGFDPRSVSVRLVVDKVALGWVFHMYFNFVL